MRLTPGSAWGRWWPWLFPAAVLTLLLLLSGLGISGSSMALLEPGGSRDPHIVAGQPRAIRSDEFQLASPAQLGNAAKGMPTSAWLGLTQIDFAATGLAVPLRDWTAAFVPENLGYDVLGDRHQAVSFAFHWWSQVAIGLLGVYGLLLALRRRPTVAAVLAVAVGLSPYSAWWGGPGAVLGFWAGAGACLVMALRSRRPPAVVAWALGASYLLVCAWLYLYPAWFVSLGIVVGLTCVGFAVDHRVGWRRLVVAGATVAVPAMALFLLWFEQNKPALQAISGTIYPGGRRSSAGGGALAVLLDAPLNPVFSDPTTIAPGGPNQSELSSVWLPWPLVLVALVLLVVQLRRAAGGGAARVDGTTSPTPGAGWAWTAFGSLAACGLLGAWALLPLPDWTGTVSLLSLVPGQRTYLAIGLALAVFLHVAVGRLRWPRPLVTGLLVAGAAVAAVGGIVWSASVLLKPGRAGLTGVVLAAVVVLGVGALLTASRAWVRAVVSLLLATVFVANYALVNPLYRGIHPLRDTPLATYVAQVARQEGPSRWVTTVPIAQPVLTASGQFTLSGMTYYPDEQVWQRLAPGQSRVWNNYAKYFWSDDTQAEPALLERIQGTNTLLMIDLCSPDVRFLDVRYVVTMAGDTQLSRCATPVRTLTDYRRRLTIWRMDQGTR